MDRPQSKQVLLIADANPENINVLKTLLSPDYDIKVATDGEEAIRLAHSPNTPGLILLNIMMPTADMYEVCKKLKADKNTKNVPIIFLSEPTTEDTEAEGFELGGADYITKPFKRSVVKARVRTHLELKRYRDNLENRLKERVSALHEEIQERRDVENTYRALVEFAATRLREHPDLGAGRLLHLTCPHLSDQECAADDAPFPDVRYKAGVRRFPKMVPDNSDSTGSAVSRSAREWLKTDFLDNLTS